MPLEKIADQAQQYLSEFQQTRSKPTSKKLRKKIIWKPPDPGTLKTNFDGAVFEDLGAAGIGIGGPKFLWYSHGSLIRDNSLSIISIGTGNCRSSKGSPLPPRTQSTWFNFGRWFKNLDLSNQKPMFPSPKRGSLDKGHYVFSWFLSIFLFLSYTTVRQCFGTCSSLESETFFSYFSLEGVCSSWHLQGVYFGFPCNTIMVLLFDRFLKKKKKGDLICYTKKK